DLSGWIDFFESAGVPPTVRKTYAQIFVDHRITDSVVADLEKDHLKDMGITVIGDIIAILKQCKKIGHEDTAVSTSKVSSTTAATEFTKKNFPPSSTQSTVVSSAATTQSQIKKSQLVQQRKGVVTQPIASFEESDADEQMNFHVILSKKAEVPSAVSVFQRLGDSVPSDPASSPAKQNEVVQRFIERNLEFNSQRTNHQMQNSRTKIVPSLNARNPDLLRTTVRTVVLPSSMVPVRKAQKRSASESVFCRLNSDPSSSRFEPPRQALPYQDVPKRPRLAPPVETFSSALGRRPVQSPHSSKLPVIKAPFRAKPITYSEGVLGCLTSQSESSVKSRLGNFSGCI
ncbi:hypothetical protein FBUS_02562, partial [Fasciolopsis buskii]